MSISQKFKAIITIITPVPSPGDAGSVSGTSSHKNGKVNVWYRVSSPEGSWVLFQGNVSVDGSGDWTATGTITDVGTYDFKAVDTTDAYGFIEIDDIVVAGGVMLTAFQVTNAPSAASPSTINLIDTILAGDNIVLALATASDKVRIAGVDYETSIASPVTGKQLVISIAKNNQTVNWVKQLDVVGFSPTSRCLAYSGGYIYAVDTRKTLANYTQSRILRINESTGVSTELALTLSDNSARATSLALYDGYIYCFGYTRLGASNAGQPVIWKVALDLGSQTLITTGSATGNGNWYVKSAFIDSNGDAFGDCAIDTGYMSFQKISLSNVAVRGLVSYTYTVPGRAAASGTRCLITARNEADGTAFTMKTKTGTSNLYRQVYNADTASSIYIGGVGFDGTDFNVFYNSDNTKFVIRKIADSNTYTKVGDDKEITPNSILSGLRSTVLSQDADYYLIGGMISGVMEAGFTQGDNTKYDAFVKLVEK
jgi:hypothetical protein